MAGWRCVRATDGVHAWGGEPESAAPHRHRRHHRCSAADCWYRAACLFGWAKPVPVNPRNYRNFKRGDILVSIAGITANLLLAVACTLLTVVVIYLARLLPALLPTFGLLVQMLRYGILINLVLAFFNLIPIPPLDGSHLFYYPCCRRAWACSTASSAATACSCCSPYSSSCRGWSASSLRR